MRRSPWTVQLDPNLRTSTFTGNTGSTETDGRTGSTDSTAGGNGVRQAEAGGCGLAGQLPELTGAQDRLPPRFPRGRWFCCPRIEGHGFLNHNTLMRFKQPHLWLYVVTNSSTKKLIQVLMLRHSSCCNKWLIMWQWLWNWVMRQSRRIWEVFCFFKD